MSVLTSLRLVCGVCCLSCGLVQAQSKTMNDMILQVKKQQEIALNPRAAYASSESVSVKKSDGSASAGNAANRPLLWSLTGLNNQLVAEVIYREKVQVLHLSEGERSIGPWVVKYYSNQGLYLVPSGVADKKDKAGIFVPAPKPGTPMQRFASALPVITPVNELELPPRPLKSGTFMADSLGEIMPPTVLNTNNGAPPVNAMANNGVPVASNNAAK